MLQLLEANIFSNINVRDKTFTQYFFLNVHMFGYLTAENNCSEKGTVLREQNSRKTVNFKKQIMYKEDKYPTLF